MLDPFDYKEPSCALCGGKQFYNPKETDPVGTIPVPRIIEKLDGLFNKNDMDGAGRLLEYWQREAVALKDLRGELSITDELIGFYRKTLDKDKGLSAVSRALEIIDILELSETVSAATIFLNAATTKKAFGLADEALPLYDKAEKIYLLRLNEFDVKFAGFYNNKALTLTDLGKFSQAEECYKKALSIVLKNKDTYPDAAVTYVNMAHLYETAEKDEKHITDCLFEAYGLLTDDQVVKNGYYAYVCSKCAPSFNRFGYSKIAEELLSESEKIYERN